MLALPVLPADWEEDNSTSTLSEAKSFIYVSLSNFVAIAFDYISTSLGETD